MDDGERLRKNEWANEKRKCPFCEEKPSNANIARHIRTSHKNVIRCPNHNCSMYFDDPDKEEKRDQHIKEVHGNLQCNFCKKKFDTKSKLNSHKQYHHKATKRCEECNEQVKSGDWAHHRLEKKCTGCMDQLKCASLFQQHKKSCHPVLCPVCSNITVQIVYLSEEHMEEQHNIQFGGTENRDTKNFCLVCDKYLPIPEKLMDHCKGEEVHTRNHTDISRGVKEEEKPIISKEKLECDPCKKRFDTKKMMKTHIRTRRTTKPCEEFSEEVKLGSWSYHRLEKKCTGCKEIFKCAGLCKQHKKSCHPVHCPVCSNISVQNIYLLEEHLKQEHNIQFSGTENRDAKNYCLVCYKYLPISEKFDHCQEESHIRNYNDELSRRVTSSSRSAAGWSVENVYTHNLIGLEFPEFLSIVICE